MYTSQTLHPWYETQTPLVLNLPASSTQSQGNMMSSLAHSNCFNYKYSIWEGGVMSRFENSKDAESDASSKTSPSMASSSGGAYFIRSLHMQFLSRNEEYVVSDFLGLKSAEFNSSNVLKVNSNDSQMLSRSFTRNSSSGLIMMDMGRSNHSMHKAILKPKQSSAVMNLDSTDGVVVASAFLPVHLHRSDEGRWTAEWDYEALLSMSTHLRVTRVGTVKWRGWHGNTGAEGSPEGGVPINERPAVEKCLEEFNCVPVWCSTKEFGEM